MSKLAVGFTALASPFRTWKARADTACQGQAEGDDGAVLYCGGPRASADGQGERAVANVIRCGVSAYHSTISPGAGLGNMGWNCIAGGHMVVGPWGPAVCEGEAPPGVHPNIHRQMSGPIVQLNCNRLWITVRLATSLRCLGAQAQKRADRLDIPHILLSPHGPSPRPWTAWHLLGGCTNTHGMLSSS